MSKQAPFMNKFFIAYFIYGHSRQYDMTQLREKNCEITQLDKSSLNSCLKRSCKCDQIMCKSKTFK